VFWAVLPGRHVQHAILVPSGLRVFVCGNTGAHDLASVKDHPWDLDHYPVCRKRYCQERFAELTRHAPVTPEEMEATRQLLLRSEAALKAMEDLGPSA